jgi:molybdate transport system substrate-binding protein
MIVAAGLGACSGGEAGSPASRRLTVFAAASLTGAFTDLGTQFQASYPGIEVTFNFAGSHRLLAQLEAGAQADVFAAADTLEMNAAVAAALVDPGSAHAFAHNHLIVIFPAANPGGLTALADLARPGLKLDLVSEAMPCGRYSLEMLDLMAADPAFGPGFREGVLANVVSYEENVRAVVSKVALGEADAGIVYVSDVAGSEADLGTLSIADSFNPLATYPIAPLLNAAEPELAAEFIALVVSAEGQQTLVDHGFLPLEASEP